MPSQVGEVIRLIRKRIALLQEWGLNITEVEPHYWVWEGNTFLHFFCTPTLLTIIGKAGNWEDSRSLYLNSSRLSHSVALFLADLAEAAIITLFSRQYGGTINHYRSAGKLIFPDFTLYFHLNPEDFSWKFEIGVKDVGCWKIAEGTEDISPLSAFPQVARICSLEIL